MFDTIESALESLKKGELIIVVDDENRENEGDLVGVAEYLTPQAINFMAAHGRGLICTPLAAGVAGRLKLPMMTDDNTDPHATAFTVSVDHKSTTTGISAFERYDTVQALADGASKYGDFNTPGHVFPLVAKAGGVLERMGHTEAAVDLCRLAEAEPVGVICEIMNGDGTMARVPDLAEYKDDHGLKMITIESLKDFILTDNRVALDSKVELPTQYGAFKMYGFKDNSTNEEHVALVHGKMAPGMNVRIHSECLTGDVFHSERCDCGAQLDEAMKIISEEDGIILYMRQEGRGIGLLNKLKAYELIEQGHDTVTANAHLGFNADLRNYDAAAAMLKTLKLSSITLLSNNPKKVSGLERNGISVNRRSHIIEANINNADYLNVKKEKLGHQL